MNQILSGYHAHRVYCNGWLIASFMTERLQQQFIAERRAKWPANDYATTTR